MGLSINGLGQKLINKKNKIICGFFSKQWKQPTFDRNFKDKLFKFNISNKELNI